ncbi:Ubiquinone/menaquinone biosynthesis C-methyltransferase UbiE [Streptomyces sp. YIM 130001]|uniref:methyltransferase domain-containing protein n=1 Tax=Streptomyces sp. YIM 130001 TaxID=2259644 RepID=UPI000E64E38B|nr:methyltransferase domain-containing protein [Streptomyces sp. YIM 130001]RII18455.1 Ubiquinone/menaquinone biosynthesis C-methyltransferase UbiE [Streptomyces sp. YIM 130001]
MTQTDSHLLGHPQPEQPGDVPPTADPSSPPHAAAAPPRPAGQPSPPPPPPSRGAALAALLDPATMRRIDRLGLTTGWRCWVVEAGGDALVGLLAKRVGPTGRVVATDLDVSWARSPIRPPLEVVRHDIGRDAPPGEGFDLVHVRLALAHVPDREQALRTMIRALRPGGRLLVEEADPALQPLPCPDEYGAAQQLANRIGKGCAAVLAGHGGDRAQGRTLPRLLREYGLVQVGADAHFALSGPEAAALDAATVGELRDRLVTGGCASDAEIDRHLEQLASGALEVAAPPLVSAWGRRPAR